MKRLSMNSRFASASHAVLLLIAALAVAAPARAQDVLTPEHVARLRLVTQATLSPDGSVVAYALSVPRRPGKDKDGPNWTELHIVDRQGTSRPYVTGEVNVSRLAWAPDGRSIAYLAKRGDDEHRSLYLIPLDGGESRRLLQHDADIKEYSFSPDGARVAFLAEEPEPKEKKDLAEKGFKQKIYEEELRPVRVWIAELNQKDSKPRPLDLPGSASELHWSPVDNRLAVALAPTPLIDDHYMRRTLHVVDAGSGEILARLDRPGKMGQVEWSPSGAHLAMIAAADLHDPLEGRLVVAPAAGGPWVDLLPSYEGHVSNLAWQDADTLMFLGDEGVWTTFNEIRRDGTEHKVIVPTGGAVLTSLTLAADGQSGAFLGQTPKHPSEVYFMAHGDPGPRRLTDSNPWLADLRLAEQEVVSYRARDAVQLHGLLIRPLDFDAAKRYPLIITVHGGPEAHYRNGWLTSYSSPGQTAAARGFAVFYPNYRASTGRGVEFAKRDHGDFAGKEFDDLVDAADHLIQSGLADPDRVGVTGGSYGGYASAWSATFHSEHFAAAVMFVGISDAIAKAGTTDIPDEIYLVHQRLRPWEDWQLFLERSPIYHAGNSRTPILILHGEDDPRVHPSQSLELYRYLKLHGNTPVRLVLYPGEGHGNRRAAARYDYNLRMLRWFEHYLKGPGGGPPDADLDYGLEKKEKAEDEQ